MQRFLIILGALLVALGVLWPIVSRLGIRRLPGDIHVVRNGFDFYFPVTTSIVVSLVLTLLIWLLRK